MDVPVVAPGRAHRWALYAAAGPVFDRAGFRGSTVAELAWAAGLRPASLYHYFPSKAALALFPLSAEGGLCETWHRHAARLADDPVLRLNALMDFISAYFEPIGLAFRLVQEMSNDRMVAGHARATMAEARRDFRFIAESIYPHLDPPRADDLFQAVATLVGGRVPGIDRDRAALRRQLGDLARGWVASLGSEVAGSPITPSTTTGSPAPVWSAPTPTLSASKPT